MTFLTVSTILLGVACGSGGMIYLIVAIWHWRNHHRVVGFWYGNLVIAYFAGTYIIAGRQLGFFQELPRGISLLLLAPIIGIPPAIQWVAWLKARRLVREQRGDI